MALQAGRCKRDAQLQLYRNRYKIPIEDWNRVMLSESYENVWDAIADTPHEAANLTMRSEIMIAIGKRVDQWKVTQAEAALRLGITQPRLNALLKGKITKFSLDALFILAHKCGLKMKIKIASND